MNSLKWKQDGYHYFAHGADGMYIIEQRRGEFKLSIMLAAEDPLAKPHDMGTFVTSAAAKKCAERDHKNNL